MQIIKKIRNNRASRITLSVPVSLRNRAIEVVFRPVKEERTLVAKSTSRSMASFMRFAKSHRAKLPAGYKFNREELHERGVL